jgi:hypothetical protein
LRQEAEPDHPNLVVVGCGLGLGLVIDPVWFFFGFFTCVVEKKKNAF